MYLNKVFILGNLTADPQLRSTTNGIPVASFSVATNRVFKDKDGVTRTDVQYHNVVTWGRTAEIVNQFSIFELDKLNQFFAEFLHL